MPLSGHLPLPTTQRLEWDTIYSDLRHQSDPSLPGLIQPPSISRMQSSRSNLSLVDLSAALGNMGLDRTASSTPAARHKADLSPSQDTGGVMLTPPFDDPSTDPFLASHNNNKKDSSKEHALYLESKAEDDVFRRDTKPRSDIDLSPTTTTQEVAVYVSPNTKITPRSDRLMDPITPQNAQGVLSPDACVFVANLSVNRTDDQLEQSVHNTFDQFGECIVKVRRDKHRHPYALVQYHAIEDAAQAIEGGRDLFVDDRKIRTERAEARREYIKQNGDIGSSYGTGSVVLNKLAGGSISKDEAEELLSRYGPIQEMYPTTHQDGRLHGVPEGMWVKFAYYLDFKDALKLFNNTTTFYRIMEPPNLEPRVRSGPVASGSPVVQGLRTPRSTTDQKSIFVGNLPHDVSEAELLEIFAHYGQIKGCNVIRKPITGGQGYNIFGFIEYSDISEAEAAAEAEIDVRGQRIRVEPKEYSARRHTRLQPFGQPSSAERPQRTVAWGPSNNAYQSQAGALPYGFQPIYVQQPPTGMSPFPQGYGWATTPPNSGQRRRAPTADEYMYGGSPHTGQQYIAMGHPAYGGMPSFRGSEGEDHQHPPRRYR